MGAQTFTEKVHVPKETSDSEAFREAKERAGYDNGHGGYSGTLAEKGNFIMIHRANSEVNADRIVNQLMGPLGHPVYREEMTAVVDDKWGPAGAIRYPIDKITDGIIFFGWASS